MSYFLYQECEFPIFLTSENLIHMYIICFQKMIFFSNNQILCIKNDIWYQKKFLISENNRYYLKSRNRISDVIKSFSGIKKIEYMISKNHFLISENTSKILKRRLIRKYTGFSDMKNSNFWYQKILVDRKKIIRNPLKTNL